jgi:hypothetical protein
MNNFNSNLIDNHNNLYSDEHMNMLNYFNNMTNLNLVQLSNNDFRNGTYRITNPGIYQLTENIIFSPNDSIYTSVNCHDLVNVLDNFHPTKLQLDKYPKPPYQFGFFAAITIECDNVIIDLNNFSIEQSKVHHIHQRFFTCIELNKSPFIKTQGPSDFGNATGNNGDFPKYIYIKNGILGRTSHHSIHGNGNKNVLLENLIIKDFEVGAIAINGGENIICRHINITNSLQDVPINFLYSNALYTRRFLYQLWENNPDAFLLVNGTNKQSIKEIICNLQTEMIEHVYLPLINNQKITSKLFKNESNLPEGNIYGIVINGLGVVVNDFVINNTDMIGNKNIVIHNISLSNITSFPREILTLTDDQGLHKGAVGNIMPYLLITDTNNGNIYKPNVMANATVILAKYSKPNGDLNILSKSLYIPTYMINEWFETNEDINKVITKNNLKYVNLRDQMAHYMKGNIIIFISGGNNITVNRIELLNIGNVGPHCDCDENRKNDYKFVYETPDYPNYKLFYSDWKGDDIVPILISGSSNININKIYCNNILTKNGKCYGIKSVGNCKEINCLNISISEDDLIKKVNYISGYQYGMRDSYKSVINYIDSNNSASKKNITNMSFLNFNFYNTFLQKLKKTYNNHYNSNN